MARPQARLGDISSHGGIIITGGTAQLRNLDLMLTQQIGVPCYVADNPVACVALGAGMGLEIRQALERAAMPVYY